MAARTCEELRPLIAISASTACYGIILLFTTLRGEGFGRADKGWMNRAEKE
jgi:hypothetical protein